MKKIIFFWIVFLLTIVSAEAAKQLRSFFLTQGMFTGAKTLTACADGYHMASLWEILEVSNLKYDTALGFTKDDSGFGPPNFVFGWIRTGHESSGTSQIPGVENCLVWTSDSSSHTGTEIGLSPNWTAQTTDIGPWLPTVRTCDTVARVWCVQN